MIVSLHIDDFFEFTSTTVSRIGYMVFKLVHQQHSI